MHTDPGMAGGELTRRFSAQQQSVEPPALHGGLQSLEMLHETHFRGATTANYGAKRSIIAMILAADPTCVKRAGGHPRGRYAPSATV
jgi:hypothetical protein